MNWPPPKKGIAIPVTIDKKDRLNDSENAISRMMSELGERSIAEVQFETNKPPFDKVYATTWQSLEDCALIEQDHTHEDRLFRLTGNGWIAGLQLTEIQQSPEFTKQVGDVMAALKAHVKACQRQHDVFPEVDEIATAAGVPEGFVFNFVESHYAEVMLKLKGARWNRRGDTIRVPVDFGHRQI